ncbi:ABC transporter ATP-binding protein [Anaerocolumna cellulosilytica]|uniref:ABC transporter ATP-binding protein n=1 Tax=Anaerocolumna cellulosilytica TaxID=433286 RepID=A0A6S6R394_9FIRM|nr:ABC transporter ATP-binding protein [Anaerocolumna cellulosilytica]MBB5195576.1 putative ABC transport system ATP-binding protein [Anaerocolumna cellulosilytica]BCJ93820.1 ABC transporter ATP-binding protein [Anaerocolumna cellulosilytica]
MSKVILGENIEKFFGEGKEKTKVLDNITVSVEEGEFVSVMGPSGSGKSTLLFALGGIDRVDKGRIVFDGNELSAGKEKKLSDIRRTGMGFVFQQPTMLKNLNLLDNIILPAVRQDRGRIEQITKRALELMRQAGIEELAKRDITQVSGGQLQRAGICRALINKPKIVFGDEPTGALNSKSAETIMELFTEINQEGTAVMLVTHDARVAACSERVLFLCDGKVVSELRLSKYKEKDMKRRMEQVTGQMRVLGI